MISPSGADGGKWMSARRRTFRERQIPSANSTGPLCCKRGRAAFRQVARYAENQAQHRLDGALAGFARDACIPFSGVVICISK